MDRNEAMWRELNLYPQWTLRAPELAAVSLAPTHTPAIEPSAQHASLVLPALVTDEIPITNLPVNNESQPNGTSLIAAVDFAPAKTWPELMQQVRDCQHCGLRAGCSQTVFGVGERSADWLFVGDIPRADEDSQGEPFAGEIGHLLDNMLAAMQLRRANNVYLTNVVKCRPRDDTHPAVTEIAQCLPYLHRQIELVQPKVIVALGKVAASSLLGEEVALDELRGVLHDYQGIPVIVTYHPAYLLRKPTAKAQAWQDLCFALDVMSEA